MTNLSPKTMSYVWKKPLTELSCWDMPQLTQTGLKNENKDWIPEPTS